VSAVVVVFVTGAIACVVGHIAILASVIRRPSASYPSARAESVPRPRPFVEVVWAIVPIVALALVLTATWGHVRENATRPPPPRADVMMKIAK